MSVKSDRLEIGFSIFETCTVHSVERVALILEIKNKTPNITLN